MHKYIDIFVYAYASIWTIGFLIITYLGRIKKTKVYRFLENCYYWVLIKFFPKKLQTVNLKRLSRIPKQHNEKRYTIKGTPIYAKNQLEAMKKYAEVLKMEVVYKEIKVKF